MYEGLKDYWRSRGYVRLDGSGSGRRRRSRVENRTNRKRRFWRIKIAPRIRFPRLIVGSPKKLLVWIRDAYVKMMTGLANSRVVTTAAASGYGGPMGLGLGLGLGDGINGLSKAPMKEYDEKVLVEFYKSLLMAQMPQTNIVPERNCTGAACRR